MVLTNSAFVISFIYLYFWCANITTFFDK